MIRFVFKLLLAFSLTTQCLCAAAEEWPEIHLARSLSQASPRHPGEVIGTYELLRPDPHVPVKGIIVSPYGVFCQNTDTPLKRPLARAGYYVMCFTTRGTDLTDMTYGSTVHLLAALRDEENGVEKFLLPDRVGLALVSTLIDDLMTVGGQLKDPTYRAQMPGFEAVADDLPVFLFGASMGGYLALSASTGVGAPYKTFKTQPYDAICAHAPYFVDADSIMRRRNLFSLTPSERLRVRSSRTTQGFECAVNKLTGISGIDYLKLNQRAPDDVPLVYYRISPQFCSEKVPGRITAPLFITHGTFDDNVPIEETRRFADTLYQAETAFPFEYREYPFEHGINNRSTYINDLELFFAKTVPDTLKPKGTAKDRLRTVIDRLCSGQPDEGSSSSETTSTSTVDPDDEGAIEKITETETITASAVQDEVEVVLTDEHRDFIIQKGLDGTTQPFQLVTRMENRFPELEGSLNWKLVQHVIEEEKQRRRALYR